MNSLRIFVLITALIALSNASTRFLHEVWGYKYKSEILPSKWYMFQPKCLGKHQSPININFGETLFDKRLKPIQIVKHSNETNEIWHIVNNGHSGRFYCSFEIEKNLSLVNFSINDTNECSFYVYSLS